MKYQVTLVSRDNQTLILPEVNANSKEEAVESAESFVENCSDYSPYGYIVTDVEDTQ